MSRHCILLCEDQTHAMFACRFLEKKGWRVQKVDKVRSGENAEQYVREKYPKQLAMARKKNVALVLFVMIDADNKGADKRLRQLGDACRAQKIDEQRKTDRFRVAVFVPDRAIEDWIRYLEGNPGLTKAECKDKAKSAAKKLLDICARGKDAPDGFPSSLKDACGEWRQFA